MFSPSTAPRWKMAINNRRRPDVAAAVRARNDGAKPSDSIVMAPDFRNMRREVMALISLATLEVWTTDFFRSLRRQLLRDVHARHERARRHPRFRGVVVAGRRLTLVRRHPKLLQRLQQPLRLTDVAARGAYTADDELERRFDFDAAILRGEELG